MSTTDTAVTTFDVLIVGAGISGIGTARYLTTEHPDKTFAILEGSEASGGTWNLFTYPGIRSDSDLHTFGYEFKPWEDEKAIAGADKILAYLREAATENGIDRHIRYQHHVHGASWSSETATWTVDVERKDTGERTQMSARWIFSASGYYRYDEGYTPHFEGREQFAGQVVHPQHWPADLDHTGKRVVVIGSGATAVTLLPAMAETAEHVTMLQRTPSYVLPVPSHDAIGDLLKRVLGPERGYAATRWKNVRQQALIWQLCGRYPQAARKLIRWVNAKQLPEGYPVDTHFNPPYNPWEQRLCAVPDGDLFRAIRQGKASVVTDHIESFTATGIQLASGEHLEADIIVTATGLNLQAFGGIELTIDGRPADLSESVAYKGAMLSGIPNFAYAIGYTNSSWTLKIGLLNRYFCRLLAHMDEHGYDAAWPVADPDMPTRPLLDFGAGYVQRAVDRLPKQGDAAPWLTSMSFQADRVLLGKGDIADEHLHFSSVGDRAAALTGAGA